MATGVVVFEPLSLWCKAPDANIRRCYQQPPQKDRKHAGLVAQHGFRKGEVIWVNWPMAHITSYHPRSYSCAATISAHLQTLTEAVQAEDSVSQWVADLCPPPGGEVRDEVRIRSFVTTQRGRVTTVLYPHPVSCEWSVNGGNASWHIDPATLTFQVRASRAIQKGETIHLGLVSAANSQPKEPPCPPPLALPPPVAAGV